MPNPLHLGGAPSPPNPDMPQGPSPAASPMAPAQPQQAPPPPPTHQQTVAALRHFDAIEQELTTLLKDPDLGKADMKSKIIDGTTSLVAKRIVSPAQAVMQLGSVPDRPFDQKQWLLTHYQQTVQAGAAVLAHHGAGVATGMTPIDTTAPNPDDHQTAMAGVMSNYSGKSANG